MTAKIIKSDDVNVTLGYDDGRFEEVPRAALNLGEFAPNGTVKVYAIAKTANAGVPADASGKHKVNKLAYVLCALLVGGIGVHKFYAGRIGFGIVYFLFCWTFIPALIALIEGIVAATKTADADGNIWV